jgi:hypothetical protein
LKIAHAAGLMPTIHVADVDLAAWTLTHTMMGVAHTLIW